MAWQDSTGVPPDGTDLASAQKQSVRQLVDDWVEIRTERGPETEELTAEPRTEPTAVGVDIGAKLLLKSQQKRTLREVSAT